MTNPPIPGLRLIVDGEHLPNHGYIPPTRTTQGQLPQDPRPTRQYKSPFYEWREENNLLPGVDTSKQLPVSPPRDPWFRDERAFKEAERFLNPPPPPRVPQKTPTLNEIEERHILEQMKKDEEEYNRRKTKPGQIREPGDHLPFHGYGAPTRTMPGYLPTDPRLLRKDVIDSPRAHKILEKTYIRPQNEAEESIVRKQMKKDEEEYKKELQRLQKLQKQKTPGTGLHPNNK